MLSRHVIKRWNMHGLQISTALPNATVNSAECGCCKRSKVISWEGWDGESDLTCGGVSGFRAALPPSPHWQESSFPAHELRALSPRLDIQMKEEASSSSFFFFFFFPELLLLSTLNEKSSAQSLTGRQSPMSPHHVLFLHLQPASLFYLLVSL